MAMETLSAIFGLIVLALVGWLIYQGALRLMAKLGVKKAQENLRKQKPWWHSRNWEDTETLIRPQPKRSKESREEE